MMSDTSCICGVELNCFGNKLGNALGLSVKRVCTVSEIQPNLNDDNFKICGILNMRAVTSAVDCSNVSIVTPLPLVSTPPKSSTMRHGDTSTKISENRMITVSIDNNIFRTQGCDRMGKMLATPSESVTDTSRDICWEEFLRFLFDRNCGAICVVQIGQDNSSSESLGETFLMATGFSSAVLHACTNSSNKPESTSRDSCMTMDHNSRHSGRSSSRSHSTSGSSSCSHSLSRSHSFGGSTLSASEDEETEEDVVNFSDRRGRAQSRKFSFGAEDVQEPRRQTSNYAMTDRLLADTGTDTHSSSAVNAFASRLCSPPRAVQAISSPSFRGGTGSGITRTQSSPAGLGLCLSRPQAVSELGAGTSLSSGMHSTSPSPSSSSSRAALMLPGRLGTPRSSLGLPPPPLRSHAGSGGPPGSPRAVSPAAASLSVNKGRGRRSMNMLDAERKAAHLDLALPHSPRPTATLTAAAAVSILSRTGIASSCNNSSGSGIKADQLAVAEAQARSNAPRPGPAARSVFKEFAQRNRLSPAMLMLDIPDSSDIPSAVAASLAAHESNQISDPHSKSDNRCVDSCAEATDSSEMNAAEAASSTPDDTILSPARFHATENNAVKAIEPVTVPAVCENSMYCNDNTHMTCTPAAVTVERSPVEWADTRDTLCLEYSRSPMRDREDSVSLFVGMQTDNQSAVCGPLQGVSLFAAVTSGLAMNKPIVRIGHIGSIKATSDISNSSKSSEICAVMIPQPIVEIGHISAMSGTDEAVDMKMDVDQDDDNDADEECRTEQMSQPPVECSSEVVQCTARPVEGHPCHAVGAGLPEVMRAAWTSCLVQHTLSPAEAVAVVMARVKAMHGKELRKQKNVTVTTETKSDKLLKRMCKKLLLAVNAPIRPDTAVVGMRCAVALVLLLLQAKELTLSTLLSSSQRLDSEVFSKSERRRLVQVLERAGMMLSTLLLDITQLACIVPVIAAKYSHAAHSASTVSNQTSVGSSLRRSGSIQHSTDSTRQLDALEQAPTLKDFLDYLIDTHRDSVIGPYLNKLVSDEFLESWQSSDDDEANKASTHIELSTDDLEFVSALPAAASSELCDGMPVLTEGAFAAPSVPSSGGKTLVRKNSIIGSRKQIIGHRVDMGTKHTVAMYSLQDRHSSSHTAGKSRSQSKVTHSDTGATATAKKSMFDDLEDDYNDNDVPATETRDTEQSKRHGHHHNHHEEEDKHSKHHKHSKTLKSSTITSSSSTSSSSHGHIHVHTPRKSHRSSSSSSRVTANHSHRNDDSNFNSTALSSHSHGSCEVAETPLTKQDVTIRLKHLALPALVMTHDHSDNDNDDDDCAPVTSRLFSGMTALSQDEYQLSTVQASNQAVAMPGVAEEALVGVAEMMKRPAGSNTSTRSSKRLKSVNN